MAKNDNGHGSQHFFTYFGLYFSGFNFLGIVLALGGIFYRWFFVLYFLLGIILFTCFIEKYKKKIIYPDRYFWAVAVLSLLFIFLNAHFTTPTIFSGRDQGSFSQAAIMMSQNHRLDVSFPAEKQFFQIYSSGHALNFPGFDYLQNGRLISQFPVGYTSWLAIFYSFFGVSGFVLANSIAFFVFMLGFYYLAKNYLESFWPLLSVILVATCFVFSWFFKFTLSENLTLPLLWLAILEFVLFLKHKKKLHLFTSIVLLLVLAFTRFEAWFFLFAAAAVLLGQYRGHLKKLSAFFGKKELFFLGVIFLVYVGSIFLLPSLYLSAIKGLYSSFFKPGQSGEAPVSTGATIWYIARLFFSYALLNYLLVALVAFFYFLKKRNYQILIPFFITLPAFIYLAHPSISLDQPWMLRRYVFAVIPASILYTTILISSLYNGKKHLFKFLLLAILLISNLAALIPTISLSDNKGLSAETKKLAVNFSPHDLVLVDRMASGNSWSMMTGPLMTLHGIQAVYFFNPGDARKIDTSGFDNVYVVIPEQSWALYQNSAIADKLHAVNDYSIKFDMLTLPKENKNDIISEPITFPELNPSITYGKIFKLEK